MSLTVYYNTDDDELSTMCMRGTPTAKEIVECDWSNVTVALIEAETNDETYTWSMALPTIFRSMVSNATVLGRLVIFNMHILEFHGVLTIPTLESVCVGGVFSDTALDELLAYAKASRKKSSLTVYMNMAEYHNDNHFPYDLLTAACNVDMLTISLPKYSSTESLKIVFRGLNGNFARTRVKLRWESSNYMDVSADEFFAWLFDYIKDASFESLILMPGDNLTRKTIKLCALANITPWTPYVNLYPISMITAGEHSRIRNMTMHLRDRYNAEAYLRIAPHYKRVPRELVDLVGSYLYSKSAKDLLDEIDNMKLD